jgi:trehalose synthase
MYREASLAGGRLAEIAARRLRGSRHCTNRLGARARESVRKRFLMTRLMKDWLDLVYSFEAHFRLRGSAGA